MIVEDYIVDEVQAIREKQASKYGFDIVAIIEAAKRRQNASKHQVVSFAPRSLRVGKNFAATHHHLSKRV